MSARRFRPPVTQTGTLTDRAVNTGLLYNYLEYVSPADVNGLKHAYIKTNSSGSEVSVKPVKSDADFESNDHYGKRPTIIADMKKPMALIPRISPNDSLYKKTQQFQRSLMRSALRKIVDEV